MIKSMTGFGRAEGETGLGKVLVEVRSVNHRYCEISLKLPKRLAPFEARVKEGIRSEVSRGKIDLSLRLDQTGEGKGELSLDVPLARQYIEALRTLKESFHLQGEITIDLVATGKDLIVTREEAEDIEPYWPEMQSIVKQSLSDMDRMKRLEGESLEKDLRERLDWIDQEIDKIKERFPQSLKAYEHRLHERLRSLLEGNNVDPARFQQEVAFLAERSDITEEVVRGKSHLVQFEALLSGGGPVGRKMDFLLQEINREVNTVTSKAADATISQIVVGIKAELEKIREQVQNIE